MDRDRRVRLSADRPGAAADGIGVPQPEGFGRHDVRAAAASRHPGGGLGAGGADRRAHAGDGCRAPGRHPRALARRPHRPGERVPHPHRRAVGRADDRAQRTRPPDVPGVRGPIPVPLPRRQSRRLPGRSGTVPRVDRSGLRESLPGYRAHRLLRRRLRRPDHPLPRAHRLPALQAGESGTHREGDRRGHLVLRSRPVRHLGRTTERRARLRGDHHRRAGIDPGRLRHRRAGPLSVFPRSYRCPSRGARTRTSDRVFDGSPVLIGEVLRA